MLNVIRNLVKSIAGKILLLIMVASFAVWGMGDLLRSGDSGLVAIVGNQKITINEFYYQFQKKLNEFNQSLEEKLTEQEAHNQQITFLVLNEMVYGKMIQEFSENNSIYLSDNIIKKAIISIPQFHDKDGNFNKILFDNSIISNFNSEAEFTNEISKIFLNNLFFENFTVPTPLNNRISDLFFNYEAETRDILYFNIDNTLIEKIPSTYDGALSYYNNNKSNYLIDKKILVRYLNANPSSFTPLVDITSAEIESYYEENIGTYSSEETRDIEIINTNSIEHADKIIELINKDIQLTEFLNNEGLSISKINNVKLDDFDDEIAINIFNNPIGIISNPVKVDGIGYFVIKINKINPYKVVSLEESKVEIIQILEDEKSYKIFLENIDLIEELNLTGSSLDEISNDFNLAIKDAYAKDLSKIISPNEYEAFLDNDIGYQSDLIINDNDDIYIIKILNIIESSIPSYLEIKDNVDSDYNNFQTDLLLSAKITELENTYKNTDREIFEDFANKKNLILLSKNNIKRNETDIFNQSTLDKIFEANKDSSVMFKSLNGKYGLVFIKKIIHAKDFNDHINKENLNTNIISTFNKSMENILRKKLGDDIKYELFLNNVNNLFL